MKTTINTPEGPRLIPEWAKCHCVTRHSPNYIHPYPFALPDGTELWLCPNTYHQANTLLKLYKSLDGPPIAATTVKFNYFVRSLLTYYWQQELEARADLEEFQKNYPETEDIYETIKKTPAYE